MKKYYLILSIIIVVIIFSVSSFYNQSLKNNQCIRSIANAYNNLNCNYYIKPFLNKNEKSHFNNLLTTRAPIIVAHGKNTNIAPESTWENISYSIENGGKNFGVIEVDVRMTKDGNFIISHDPTFHRLINGYQTPQTKIDDFIKNHPKLAEKYKDRWDFFLFDEVASYTLAEITQDSSKMIFNPKTQKKTPFITLDKIIESISIDGKFIIPKNQKEIDLKTPLLYYLDLKDINHLAARLEGLSDWHWIRTSLSTAELTIYTEKVIKNLSLILKKHNQYEKIFITVRHKNILKMINKIDPNINTMFSPEIITKESNAETLIFEMRPCLINKCRLIELKYLIHVLNPKIRKWANENNLKIFYNQIKQTDQSQFEGKYKNNLSKLINDILQLGENIILQTNTVKELANIIEKR